jgi:hypothetical protein
MRRIYGGMAALFFLTGCAADANDGYRKVLDAYLGKPESTLTASLGTPESIYSGDGGYRYLSYPNQKKTDTPATPAIYVTSCRFNICTSTTTEGGPATPLDTKCHTIFLVVGDNVTNYSYDPNCR